MALEILRDPRLERVEWQDLCDLGRLEVVYEVAIYVPWLLASWLFAYWAFTWSPFWLVAALASSFMFFLCGLRQVHNAFHYAVGVSPRAHEWLMFVLSPLMMVLQHQPNRNLNVLSCAICWTVASGSLRSALISVSHSQRSSKRWVTPRLSVKSLMK